jgi:hypothetical protein
MMSRIIQITERGDTPSRARYYWPEGALFQNPFGTGPPEGPQSLRDNGGFGFVFVSEKIFFIRSLMPRARFPHLTTQ